MRSINCGVSATPYKQRCGRLGAKVALIGRCDSNMTSPVVPPTLREKSSWTPKHNKPANEKVTQIILVVVIMVQSFLL